MLSVKGARLRQCGAVPGTRTPASTHQPIDWLHPLPSRRPLQVPSASLGRLRAVPGLVLPVCASLLADHRVGPACLSARPVREGGQSRRVRPWLALAPKPPRHLTPSVRSAAKAATSPFNSSTRESSLSSFSWASSFLAVSWAKGAASGRRGVWRLCCAIALGLPHLHKGFCGERPIEVLDSNLLQVHQSIIYQRLQHLFDALHHWAARGGSCLPTSADNMQCVAPTHRHLSSRQASRAPSEGRAPLIPAACPALLAASPPGSCRGAACSWCI